MTSTHPANSQPPSGSDGTTRKSALRFVLLIGVVSLFADFTYEGSRAITGPYLLTLGASGALVGVIAGFGELLVYGLRFLSGQISERTQRFWPITFFGYIVQMAAVPLLAIADNWQLAAFFILLERIGKGVRNPPRDVMLSHAAQEMGFGWGFGVHEALDQCGALIGPLTVAFILAHRGEYRLAFGALLIPAVITLLLLTTARLAYPQPGDLEKKVCTSSATLLPNSYWTYLAAAALISAGFADFSIVAFHFQKTHTVSTEWIPIFYAVAMGVSGGGSLAFGKLFDRFGVWVLIPLTILTAFFAPLVFLGGFGIAFLGAALWGLGMGVHESIIPAAVATMVPPKRRASAYGTFTGIYGLSWFVGSALIGFLYDRSASFAVLFCIATELAAVPVLVMTHRQMARFRRV